MGRSSKLGGERIIMKNLVNIINIIGCIIILIVSGYLSYTISNDLIARWVICLICFEVGIMFHKTIGDWER
jgi:uncharacterized membrane protein YfcA